MLLPKLKISRAQSSKHAFGRGDLLREGSGDGLALISYRLSSISNRLLNIDNTHSSCFSLAKSPRLDLAFEKFIELGSRAASKIISFHSGQGSHNVMEYLLGCLRNKEPDSDCERKTDTGIEPA